MMQRAPMARTSARAPRLSSEPNVIPFIDVLLVLLIIFMVTAPKPTVDLHVALPRGTIVDRRIIPTVVSIQDAGGGYAVFVDAEAVGMDQLGARTLAHAVSNNPEIAAQDIFANARVFVRADQSTAYGNVVDVMNALREAHFARVGIFAEQAQEPS